MGLGAAVTGLEFKVWVFWFFKVFLQIGNLWSSYFSYIRKGSVVHKHFTDFEEYSYSYSYVFCVVFLCRACLLFGVNAGRNCLYMKGSVVYKNFTDS